MVYNQPILRFLTQSVHEVLDIFFNDRGICLCYYVVLKSPNSNLTLLYESQKIQSAVIAKASQTIISADSFDILWQEIDCIDPFNTLVVFDIDHTLVRPSSLIFADHWKECVQKIKALDKSGNKDKQNLFISKILAKDPYVLVEEKISSLINKLQEKNIKTIALTGASSGAYGCIESMVQWRLTQLSKFGISFKFAFPQIKEILKLQVQNHSVLDIVAETPQDPAVFCEGIIFCGYYDKGESLEQFLATLQWIPKRIIFADDLDAFVKSVEAMCQRKNIDYLGIHYHGAEKGHPAADPILSEFQLKYLAEHEEWLNDNEAQAIMLAQKTLVDNKSTQPFK
jgi:hypothetical protein